MKRIAAALFVLAVTAPPVAAGGGCVEIGVPLLEEVTDQVRTDHACWSPGAAVVTTGTTVTFTNPHNGMQHNLSGPGIGYAELANGATHRVTFGRPGYYPYQCTIHPGMAGVVIVRDAVATGAASAAAAAAPSAPATGETAGGGGRALGWVAAAGVVGTIGAVAFTRRARGVPVPAR
ncbi:MAG TPA: hypothetical protein VNA20_13025 [Frankiaceae bacterium]|nr:hypothetical protein [Frankiaceae bacterium]